MPFVRLKYGRTEPHPGGILRTDVADAGGTPQFNMIPTNFSVAGVNNIDLQVAFQFTSGTPTASSLSVTLYFE